jgi:monoterpene epsilon-lactone hydrolase
MRGSPQCPIDNGAHVLSDQMNQSLDRLWERRRAVAGAPKQSLAEVRANFIPADANYPIPGDVRVTSVMIGAVACYWLDTPNVDTDRVLLFLHGGGYQLGSLRSDGELAARLGRAGGLRVLFPEYRLAPEHPYPAAIDDVLAAWYWLRSDAGFAAHSISVVGDSAGGGLAVALMAAVHQADNEQPSCGVLMSPTIDLTSSGASMGERVGQDPISTPELLRQLAADYLDGADPRNPLASPLFGDLSGLPPILIQVGTADLLLSDSERLATAAPDMGVDVQLEVSEGLPHVYQLLARTPEAAAATLRIGRFLRYHSRRSDGSAGNGSIPAATAASR